MKPAELGALLFGPNTPAFVDKWVEGPTRAWDSISIDLATAPTATGYAGLCQLVTGAAYFTWPGAARGENDPMNLGMTPRTETQFFLTHDAADLGADSADDGSCSQQRPLQPFPAYRHLIHVWSPAGSGYKSGSVVAAQFGVRAFIAAQQAARKLAVVAERCATGFTDVPALCGDPKAFVRSIYLRQIAGLLITKCPASDMLCADVTVRDLSGIGEDHIVIATAEMQLGESSDMLSTIKSITVRAGSDPIID